MSQNAAEVPLAPTEEERIEALVAARVEQRLAAQLRDVVKVLLASTRAGCSVLESAASMGRHELLREILTVFQTSSDGIAPPNIRSDLRAATLAAASEGHPQCLQLLLDSCSSSPSSLPGLLDAKDAKDTKKRTPLLRSALGGHVECMRLLLEHSPETQVAARDASGGTALMHAALNGHASCIQLLLPHIPDTQVAGDCSLALLMSAKPGHASCVQLLLAQGPDVRRRMAALRVPGRSALCFAASNAHVDCLQLLLAHSPSQQQLDTALGEAGQKMSQLSPTPADEQRRLRFKKCIGLLLSNGAMYTAQASDGAIAAIRAIIKELTARALVPDMANEAVLGLALAATGRKRQASGEGAAGPPKHTRTNV